MIFKLEIKQNVSRITPFDGTYFWPNVTENLTKNKFWLISMGQIFDFF
jgi:hypothetical protein